jgi:hypothetical protein
VVQPADAAWLALQVYFFVTIKVNRHFEIRSLTA